MKAAPDAAPGDRSAARTLLRMATVAAAVVAVVLLGRTVGARLPAFVAWVESLGGWAPAVFIGGYALATVAMVPGSLLTLVGGAVFGVVAGTAYVFAGAVIGSALAFLAARHLARPAVERRISGDERFRRIDRAVEREGLKIVFLLRLSPVLPFVLLNYALGVTRVRFWHYVTASLGMIPGTLLYVYSGKVAGDVATVVGGGEIARGAGYWALLALGLVATVAVAVLTARIARRALRDETDAD